MRDPILVDHGTAAFSLKPSAVIAAAVHDLQVKARSKRGAAGRRYAFAWEHVSAASTPASLLALAIEHPSEGVGSPDANTRMLYRDLDLLRSALALAEKGAQS